LESFNQDLQMLEFSKLMNLMVNHPEMTFMLYPNTL
jgi:hypothetical protein